MLEAVRSAWYKGGSYGKYSIVEENGKGAERVK